MAGRKIEFITGGIYHVYNRGVEKRDIISDAYDQLRFLRSLNIFNTTESVGSIFEYDVYVKGKQKFGSSASKLVEIIAFNLLDNHYHLVLKQLVDGGITKFMHSLGTGYVNYFNEKYDRVGSLFQGTFKASSIEDEHWLEQIIAYVNLNHIVHKFGSRASKWGIRSSWEQYLNAKSPRVVEIKKWKGFNKNKSIEIVKKIKSERDEIKKNEFGPRGTK